VTRNNAGADTEILSRTSVRRGRPSRAREREITDGIVQAALRLFLADGYGATSMKRIGEEAGVAPNTLYSRFPDKAALFRAIVEWKAAIWKITIPPRRVRSRALLAEILESAAIDMIEAMEREDISAIGRLLSVEAERFPELATIYYENAMLIGRSDLVKRIERAPDCALNAADARDLVTTLVECVTGYSHLRLLQPQPTGQNARREAARRITRIIARGSTSGGAG
jgi:AcrR family transcriptional regulator